MKFRNRETGETYTDIHAARRDFCAGRFCPECQFRPELAKAHCDSCMEFSSKYPERAAELMALEVIKNEKGNIKQQPYRGYCAFCEHNKGNRCTNGTSCATVVDKNGNLQSEPSHFEHKKPVQKESQRHFETGAVRDNSTGKGRYDLLPWGAIHALAQHQERGALHYGERNVDKGIPQASLIDSGIRHLSLYIQGDPEPHHLVAALWNIAWACEQEIKRPEMIDLPERTEKSGKAV